MSKVSVIGSFTCQDGKAEETEKVLTAMTAGVRDDQGIEIYSYHRGENNTFWFFALMVDHESMQNHANNDAMRETIQVLMPLLADPPQMSIATPIVAIGFDV